MCFKNRHALTNPIMVIYVFKIVFLCREGENYFIYVPYYIFLFKCTETKVIMLNKKYVPTKTWYIGHLELFYILKSFI